MIANVSSFADKDSVAKLKSAAAMGIINPRQIEISKRTTLFRLHDGSKPLGAWWFTGFEYKRIAGLMQRRPADLLIGRSEGFSPLGSALALLSEWYNHRTDQLFRFSCVSLTDAFIALYGEGKNAPLLGGRLCARQVFLPDLQFYRDSFLAIDLQAISETQLQKLVALHGSPRQSFE